MSASVSELEGGYALTCEEVSETAELLFDDLGLEGNGHTWCGVFESLSRQLFGQNTSEFSFSPEADSVMILSKSKENLDILASEANKAFDDCDYLNRIIENATSEIE